MKNSSIHWAITFLILFQANTFLAQDLLTQAEAVRITLENNYNIQVAKNDTRVAKNNTSKQLNGFLPTVDASAGANSSLASSNQQFSNGNENTVDNAFNWGANASVIANYTILDQTRAINLKQLKEVSNLADLQLRQTIENNLLDVFSNYFEVARLSENVKVLEQTLKVSEQRLLRAKYQYDYGQGIRLDVLNAEVDIQRDSINLLNLKNQLSNTKRNLNVVMGRVVNTPIQVDTLITYEETLTYDDLMRNAQINNILISLIDKNLDISAYNIDIINSAKMPVLAVNTGYNFNFSDNATGSFIDLSTSRGLSAGLNLAWNIFDGGRRKVQKNNALINIENQRIQKEQILQQLERDVSNAWENYQNALFILSAEEKNLATNELNFQRTEEQFKAGQVTSVEFRQAQLNLLNAATNYNTAKYNAKVIELQLMQLSGNLLEMEF